ncbi:phage major capsid protein [Neobacillus niacini]|uniref:phage major capsid protein n=1 Tax=Neobacillus niacini TaxID=86668 RepID=UPI000AE036A6|nr:phage major capsid protein [Neobacillus niacini]
MNNEYRNYNVSLSGVENTSDGLFCRGIVNKPGKWSHQLTTRDGKKFIERIMPNTFAKALKRNNVVDLLAEHDKEKLLASTQNGSLTLTETADGLLMNAKLSETDYGKRYHTWIKDGLVPDMSFGFKVLKDSWEKLNDGTYKRSITDLALFEVSAVRQGAYSDGAISARSLKPVDIEIPEIEERNVQSMNYESMSLKELRQEKQKLLKDAKQMADIATLENRDLNGSEKLHGEILAEEIRTINEQILKLEKNPKGDSIKMTNLNLEQEIRATEQFIRKQDGEELRALTAYVTTPGQNAGSFTVPANLSDYIVEKVFEVAPLFSRTKNFTPANGFLDILREQDLGADGVFIGEMSTFSPADFTLDKVRLEQKRVATGIELSQHLVNDSGIDIVNYAVNVMSRRIGMALDKKILTGVVANNEFEGLLNAVSVTTPVTAATISSITIDNLLDLYNSMNPEYVGGAIWAVSRPTFNMISKLTDADGRYHLVRDITESGPVYRLFGQPVVINEAMPNVAAGAKSVFFGNLSEGYATMIKKGLELKHITGDTTQAVRGSHLLLLDGYMDGKVLNPNALRFMKHPAS